MEKLADIFRDRIKWKGGQILVQAPPGTGKTGLINLFQFNYGPEFNIVRFVCL